MKVGLRHLQDRFQSLQNSWESPSPTQSSEPTAMCAPTWIGSGLLINDAEGFERSGYGLLKVDDRCRVVLGLDSDRGTEGLVLALEDGGMSELFIQNREGQILVGTDPPDGMLNENFHGLRVKGRTREHLLNLADSTPVGPRR